MATAHSSAENSAIRTAADAVVTDAVGSVWIGASDLANEGTMLWVDGYTLTGALVYSNWNSGQPDNYRGSEVRA